MCELFAMSSRLPTTVNLSLDVFARHGSPPGRNVDGWGLVVYDDGDVRLFKEPTPAGNSEWLRFIECSRLPSPLVLSHIRHATHGAVALRNTQPFIRELGGRIHAFAHNGHLPGIENETKGRRLRFRPVGETDSELAFCLLLARMAPLWASGVPALAARLAVVRRFAARLGESGPANFLYADGDILFAHGDRRVQADGSIAPPGLFRLTRSCAVDRDALPDAGVTIGAWSPPQTLTLVASVPLTADAWTPLAEGEVVAVAAGEMWCADSGETRRRVTAT
ncbi:MAG: class II glutamine amidotransferase [Alphaproteobacteria bacterium]|nr:class II glutamine amidotransferase [Alphaproteobacteria bacterium]